VIGFFLLTIASTLAMGPAQPPVQSVLGAFALRVKWPGHEVDHSLPSSAKIRTAWSCMSIPPTHFCGVMLN